MMYMTPELRCGLFAVDPVHELGALQVRGVLNDCVEIHSLTEKNRTTYPQAHTAMRTLMYTYAYHRVYSIRL
eukprot:40218-Eustigmatos_ZCMA.PRE.1